MKKIILITGPSGIGKTYLAQRLLELYPNDFKVGRLFTTRPPRSKEPMTDRISITNDAFVTKLAAGDFIVADTFHGNHYGYPKELFSNRTHHVIINTWPALFPKFSALPNICIVALAADYQATTMLTARMSDRGDTARQIKERLPLIQNDQNDIERLRDQIEANGKVFVIKNNDSLKSEVIPWVQRTLQLQA